MSTPKKMHKGMLAGTAVVLAVALACSYFIFFAGSPSQPQQQFPLLPEWAVGAENLVTSHSFPVQPDDFSNAKTKATLVVEGVIEKVSSSQWATSDGKGPDDGNRTYDQLKSGTYQIRTPVAFSVAEVFKGDEVKDLTFSFEGGRVGNTAHVSHDNDAFEKGERLILFLVKAKPGEPAHQVDDGGLYPTMHMVVRDDVAYGPLKDVPAEELREHLR